MRDDVLAAIARATLYPYNKSKYRQYQVALAQAPRIAADTLLQLVRAHRDTGFGRAHHFSSIDSIAAYRNNVPITDYDGMQPYMDDVARGNTNALFPASERILDFTWTSGTTGAPKLLPVTRTWLKTYQRHWRIWGIKALMDHPEIMQKKWLQISGSTRLGVTESGHDIGMISAITARYQNPIMKYGFAAPHQVGNITDTATRHYALLRLAITQPVGFIITVTAANLIALAVLADQSKEALIRDLHDGSMTGAGTSFSALPQGPLQGLLRERHPERARELERIVSATGTLYPKDFWQLELVSCWIGGTVGYQSRNLPKYYGATPIRDVGYTSTEGRHTTPFDDYTTNGLLVAGGAFYEFVPETGGDPRCGHELEVGQKYSVIITTQHGLYRYRMGDVVRCNGFEGPSPILEFLCKTEQFADMEGEKVSGYNIARAMTACCENLGLPVTGFSTIPVRRDHGAPYYGLVVEPLGQTNAGLERRLIEMFDHELGQQNIVYKHKRIDGTLAPPQLLIIPEGSFAQQAASQSARSGTGESQYKQPALLEPGRLGELKILRTIECKSAAQDGPGAAA